MNYRDILSLKDNRALKVLEVLFETDYLNLTQIAETTGFSKKTIHAEINRLNTIDDNIYIETYSNLGYQLVMRENCSRDYIYKVILDNSLEIDILETLFLSDNSYTIDHLSEIFFISSSTIRRVIAKLNNVLKEFDFEITGPHLEIVGNETNIHSFFFALFSEKRQFERSFFSDIMMKNVEDLVIEIINFTNALDTVEVQEFFKLHIILNLQRYKYGNFKATEKNSSLEEFDSEIKTKLEHLMNMDLDVFFHTSLLYPFSNKSFYMKRDDILHQKNLSADVSEHMNQVISFLDFITDKYHLRLDKNELVPRLLNSIYFVKNTPYFLYNKAKAFLHSLSLEYPFISSIVSEARQFLDLPDFVLEEMVCKVIFFTDKLSLQLKQSKKFIQTIVFSDIHVKHSMLLKDILEEHYAYELAVDILELESIEDLAQKTTSFDLLITNKSNLTADIPILCINSFPQIEDYEKISTFISTWHEKNSQTLD